MNKNQQWCYVCQRAPKPCDLCEQSMELLEEESNERRNIEWNALIECPVFHYKKDPWAEANKLVREVLYTQLELHNPPRRTKEPEYMEWTGFPFY